MEVLCPADLDALDRTIRIALPDAREFDVVVPAGLVAGDSFLVGPFPSDIVNPVNVHDREVSSCEHTGLSGLGPVQPYFTAVGTWRSEVLSAKCLRSAEGRISGRRTSRPSGSGF
eukprot:4966585-Prymnesium_polylepis.1